MRSKDNQVLASMLTSMETRLLTEIGDTKDQVRDLKCNISEVKTDVVEIRTFQRAAKETHDTFRTELLGDGGRVSELEARQKSHETWQNIKFIVVLPVTLTLHKIARAMGINI